MVVESDLVFRKDLYFYQMVSAAAVSFTGSAFVFEQQSPPFGPTDYISMPGLVTGDRHFCPYDVYKEASIANVSRDDFHGTVCMMLANTAYESVKDRNDKSPTFEFFRHVRNASSHLNRFVFRPNEPKRPAFWSGITIDHSLKGDANPLQNEYCFGKMLGVADVFRLLWDVEQIIVAKLKKQPINRTNETIRD